jgi:hypothetical protein
MIKLLAFMDIESGIGRTIFSDGTIGISEELLWPMISALNNFVIECTTDDRGLVNASLEDIKIYLCPPLGETNPLRFVFFTDLYENNQYIEQRGQAVFELMSQHLTFEVFSPPEDIMEKVLEIAKFTQILPIDSIKDSFLEELKYKIEILEKEGGAFFADLFVGDIDQGEVFSFAKNEEFQEKDSVILFSELLTSFSMDNEIIAKSSLSTKEKSRLERMNINTDDMLEGWFLKQLANKESDFWLVAYFYYKKGSEEQIKEFLHWVWEVLNIEISISITDRPF